MASLLSLRLPNPKANFSVRASSPPPTSAAAAAATTIPAQPPSPPQAQQALEETFGRKGIKFAESGGVPTVELSVRNGSSLHLRIPDGLITSYRPKVYWKDDGFTEVLHTVSTADLGSPPSVRGGLGLVLNAASEPGKGKGKDKGGSSSSWSASEWAVKDADSDSFDAVQVELSSTNADGSLEITYVVSLYPVSMATAVLVKNVGARTVGLTSAILSHIKFHARRRSAIQGLRGCSYCAHPPPPSSFALLSPSDAMRPDPPSWFSFPGPSPATSKQTETERSWSVEDDLYTLLRGKFSRVYAPPPEERLKRIYTTPPSKYTTIDQVSGLGFRVIRMGYEDIYLCSPGSFSQRVGKGHFICTGPASMLVPVLLNPGEEWRGAQVIEHDNL